MKTFKVESEDENQIVLSNCNDKFVFNKKETLGQIITLTPISVYGGETEDRKFQKIGEN